jgi:hypothetical protein
MNVHACVYAINTSLKFNSPCVDCDEWLVHDDLYDDSARVRDEKDMVEKRVMEDLIFLS